MVKKRLSKLKLRRAVKVRELSGTVAERAMALNPLQASEEPRVVEKVPHITNQTITEHREEVLKGARKYIYPLQHSKRRIISVTLSIAGVAALVFLVYCTAALYKFHQYNTFIYRVTQVVPFPVARVDHNFVSYENYLFELRHFVHYYQTQQQQTFDVTNRDQLQRLRQQSLNLVLTDTYVKMIAKQNGVSVSSKDVDIRLTEARNQNRLGSSNKVFADVLRDYWGWSIADFRRSLKQEILAEKVSAKLDRVASQRASVALNQIKGGADFAEVAKNTSDDPTKVNGGDYGFAINRSNPNVPPEVVDALFKLKPGQYSGIILASPVLSGQPPSLQIVKVTQNDGTTVNGEHIVINLKDPLFYVNEFKAKHPARNYVKV